MTATRYYWSDVRCCSVLGGWGALAVALLAITAIGAEPKRTDKEIKEPGNPPLRTPTVASPELTEVRIWNVASQPFRFRLARLNGPRWTDEITIEPGKYQAIRIPKRGEPSELEGVTINSDTSYRTRFICIRFPKYGGFVETKLSLERNDEPIRAWYHVLDSNGFSDLVEAADVKEAREAQASLLRQKPLSAQEIERIKTTLKANWLLYEQ